MLGRAILSRAPPSRGPGKAEKLSVSICWNSKVKYDRLHYGPVFTLDHQGIPARMILSDKSPENVLYEFFAGVSRGQSLPPSPSW